MNTSAWTRPISADQLHAAAHLCSPAAPILELRSISCAYGSSRPAVRDIAFSVR